MSCFENGMRCLKAKLYLQDPNPEDPLNKEAADMFRDQRRAFESQVQQSIVRGAYINGSHFPACRA